MLSLWLKRMITPVTSTENDSGYQMLPVGFKVNHMNNLHSKAFSKNSRSQAFEWVASECFCPNPRTVQEGYFQNASGWRSPQRDVSTRNGE